MSREKLGLNKPPIPSRPKNLVVLNSKQLPKPPETFSSENVTNFIKDLNLDVKDEEKDKLLNKSHSSNSVNKLTIFSNGEKESFEYLDSTVKNFTVLANKCNNSQNKTIIRKKSTNNCTSQSIKHSASVFFVPGEEPKSTISQNLWHRPLPLLPEEAKSEVTNMPWYKNINRKKGEQILKNGVNGYFLVRPSSNFETYLTLTLWYNDRVYNIPIRKRRDGKFALGTPKANEQSFSSVEFLIKNYQSEKLVLYSNGVQTGKTLLTSFPS